MKTRTITIHDKDKQKTQKTLRNPYLRRSATRWGKKTMKKRCVWEAKKKRNLWFQGVEGRGMPRQRWRMEIRRKHRRILWRTMSRRRHVTSWGPRLSTFWRISNFSGMRVRHWRSHPKIWLDCRLLEI